MTAISHRCYQLNTKFDSYDQQVTIITCLIMPLKFIIFINLTHSYIIKKLLKDLFIKNFIIEHLTQDLLNEGNFYKEICCKNITCNQIKPIPVFEDML